MDARVGIGAAVVLALLVAGAGFVIIRRRRRRSLAKRLQEALPELNDLRATLKRPLQRAVKAL
jgi:NAD(P)-dependent dehydrogenase (short-subunit alcohol dehydrogenase family)